MFDLFRDEYRRTKKSTKASCLDKVNRLLDGYARGPSAPGVIAQIKTELRAVKGQWRIIGPNPAVKYAKAIAALEEELQRENDLMREIIEENRAAVGAQVRFMASMAPALSAGASASSTPKTKDELQAEQNHAKNCKRYAARLEMMKTDAEYFAPIEAAFEKLLREPKFAKYYLDEVGWTNARAWGTWMLRAMTPEMVSGPAAHEATNVLRELALRANVVGKKFAERYLLELSIYCASEAEKADVSFVMGQATTVIGFLVGPVMSAAFSGVAGYAASGAKKLVEIGATKGAQAAAVDDVASVQFTMTEESKASFTSANVMRFTQAWLRYVSTEASSPAAGVVRREFGGQAGCAYLYEHIMDM